MRLTMRTIRYSALPLLTIIARSLEAQVRPHELQLRLSDSSVAVIMRHVGARLDHQAMLLSILRGVDGVYSRAKRDEVADSLAARAIANRADGGSVQDSAQYGAAARAVMVLGRSGMDRTPALDSSSQGQLYEGALDRLIRVHRSAPARAIRSRALAAMLRQPDRARALGYVRSVAESPGEPAADAIQRLIEDATGFTEPPKPTPAQRDESLAVLRDLSTNRRVSNPDAARNLATWLRSRQR
jgi:hypothetical protein